MKICKSLIDKGANVNHDQDGNSRTPLTLAVIKHKFRTGGLLLENNADLRRVPQYPFQDRSENFMKDLSNLVR